MRNYVNAYCSVPRNQHSAPSRTSASALTDFSTSPSNQSSLSYQQPYTFPRDLEGSMNFANLDSGGGNPHPISLTNNEANTVAPTIQFDLGSNLLSCSSQQGNLNNFSAPYDYSTNEAGMGTTQTTANQGCFPNETPLSSTLWNMGGNMGNFAVPTSSQLNLSTPTNSGNGPTVDFTARWDMRNSNSINSSPVQQSGVGNNVPRGQPFVGREKPYVREPSMAVMRRIDSALEQRLYVIDRKLVGDPQAPTACDYQVLGSTGNVCTVRLATNPTCTCPDTSHPCKHILFIMLRVLKLSSGDYRIWQEALFASEVNELIRKPIIDSDALACQKGRHRFQDISNHVMDGGGDADGRLKNLQREVSGDCPVCFEEMGNADGIAKEEVSFCKVCGNNVHKDCFQRWSLSKQDSGERVTCIFCRSMWFDDPVQLKKRKAASEAPADGYVNIADYATDHQAQDMTLESLYPNMRPKYVPEWRGC